MSLSSRMAPRTMANGAKISRRGSWLLYVLSVRGCHMFVLYFVKEAYGGTPKGEKVKGRLGRILVQATNTCLSDMEWELGPGMGR